ncbi:neuronal cell adhesion molecule-like [Saccostrea echinata]|uniref:neuronal cell adhesion molecule-like n=1 Tax=Saccostrea echinata TaxID=191078 RepID=UPI002A7F8ED2|nr:neuronal cell adhesion molecule-like [Saccostrea echinata]
MKSDQHPSTDRGRDLVTSLLVVLLLGVIASVCVIYIQLVGVQNELNELKHLRDLDLKFKDEFDQKSQEDQQSQTRTSKESVQKRQTASSFVQELLLAQAHILESHCANDSRLCMRGPKGEKGDPGPSAKPLTVPTSVTSQCACLEEPKIGQLLNTVAKTGDDVDLRCPVTGNPTPYVKWIKNGVTVSRKSILHLTNVDTTTSGNYTCVAQNIIGSRTKTLLLNIQ